MDPVAAKENSIPALGYNLLVPRILRPITQNVAAVTMWGRRCDLELGTQKEALWRRWVADMVTQQRCLP